MVVLETFHALKMLLGQCGCEICLEISQIGDVKSVFVFHSDKIHHKKYSRKNLFFKEENCFFF
jgi:hypothetical protein